MLLFTPSSLFNRCFYMNYITPQNHIDEIKKICEDISSHDYIDNCSINDWGRYSNFSIIIKPKIHNKSSTNIIKKIVKNSLKESEAHIRQYFSPKLQFSSLLHKQYYDTEFWTFDIDFKNFNFYTNTFSS